jgi:hypothetical protein
VRYFCTIYTHDCTLATKQGTPATGEGDPAGGPLGRVLVSGATMREAAARAYVQCVGRERARLMQEQLAAPRRLARQETNTKAIAASLRKMSRSGDDCYLLDNFVEGWFIHVEPVLNLPCPSSRPRKLRLPTSRLLSLSHTPSPN